MATGESLQVARRLGFLDPSRLGTTGVALSRWGPSIAALYGGAAYRFPTRPAVIDHRGSLTFNALDRRSTALASGLLRLGLRPGQHLGLLCGNHRDFVEANLAAAKAGLHVVYLNTGFAAPQLAEVMEREEVAGLISDADFSTTVEAAAFEGPRVVADDTNHENRTMRDVRRLGRRQPALLIPRASNPVLLTSGTTGLPKGARRATRRSDPRAALGILRVIPYRRGDVFVIPSPLFHAWGLSQLVIAATLGSPVVLSRQFSPAGTVQAVVDHRASVLTIVPIMLQRILAQPGLDLSRMKTLRIVASSGSALPAPVAQEWMDRAGDHLYNLYGSTEVGQATIATPEDLREAPGTVGRVVPGSEVLILDDAGNEVSTGAEGRVFVDSGAQFAGYTGGGGKEVIDGRMSSGDVGYFDADDRLFVTGRADDMIVSGGENVFPGEVEDVLLALPEVTDAVVVGVDDEEFGRRLAAFVVVVDGAELDAKAVREAVRQRLARHKVPRDVTFMDELPRTITGKPLRRQLRT